jgi:hypothetical protein
MEAVRPVIASNEIPYFKMREIDSNSASIREERRKGQFSC